MSKQEEQISLSESDIKTMLNGQCNVLTYPELVNYDNINDAMGPHGALILLYMTKQNYGHWVCAFKRNNNAIEFFDSYGFFPDDELKLIPEYFRKVSNQLYPHLTYLLLKSKNKIEYNNVQLQKLKKDVNTCGRWCIVRIMLRNLTINEFVRKFQDNGDFKVTDLTSK